MANYTVTITYPKLVTGQYFKVRYRVSGGVWVDLPNQDNDPFTITGLDAGETYEVESTLFNGVSLCEDDVRVDVFTVPDLPSPPELTCLDFEAELVQNGLIYQIVLSYGLASPPVFPPCGYKIRIVQGTNVQNISRPTLNLSGEERYTVPNNNGLQVVVSADYCNGNVIECLNEDVPSINPPCQPLAIVDVDIIRDTVRPEYWLITITYNQSIPTTLLSTIFYQQNPAQVAPGRTPDNGLLTGLPIPGGVTANISFKVLPTVGQWSTPQYSGYITDYCGNQIPWSV